MLKKLVGLSILFFASLNAMYSGTAPIRQPFTYWKISDRSEIGFNKLVGCRIDIGDFGISDCYCTDVGEVFVIKHTSLNDSGEYKKHHRSVLFMLCKSKEVIFSGPFVLGKRKYQKVEGIANQTFRYAQLINFILTFQALGDMDRLCFFYKLSSSLYELNKKKRMWALEWGLDFLNYFGKKYNVVRPVFSYVDMVGLFLSNRIKEKALKSN